MELKIKMDVYIKEQYKTYNRMKKLQKNFEENPSANKGDKSVRIELLSNYYKKFCEVHEGIDKIVSKHNIDTTNSDYFKEDLAFKCELLYLKIKGELLEDQPAEASGSGEPSFRNENKSEKKTPSVETPQLDVPKFSGELTDWQAFRSKYCSLVHSNSELTNFQKFTYLQSALPIEVFETIKHFSTSEDKTNYDDAWKLLEEKFSKRAHIEGYLVKLIEQPSALEGSSDSISQLLDTTKNCLNGLQSLNVDTKNWDVFLIHLLLQKLNENTKIEWKQTHSPEKTPKLHLFFNFLKLKAQTDLKSEEIKRGSVDENTRIDRFGCAYCHRRHPLWNCEKFELLGIDERQAFVNNEDIICLRCLSVYHTILNCSKPYTCRICKSGDHHYLLHKNLKRSQSCELLN